MIDMACSTVELDLPERITPGVARHHSKAPHHPKDGMTMVDPDVTPTDFHRCIYPSLVEI
jgi:hypothetical protein